MSTREDVMSALFTLAQSIQWTDPFSGDTAGFQFTSRRLKGFPDVSGYPSLCQIEGDEKVVQKTGYPYQITLNAGWVIYHKAGTDNTVVPAALNNAIADAVATALMPGVTDQNTGRLTLGGLAYHVWINGKLYKNPGDLDGQGTLVVPISVLLPY